MSYCDRIYVDLIEAENMGINENVVAIHFENDMA